MKFKFSVMSMVRLINRKNPDKSKNLRSSKGKSQKSKVVAPVEGPMVGAPMPRTFQVLERYQLTPPFAYAVIAQDPEQRVPQYYVDELELTYQEKVLYNNIIETLQTELKAPREDVDPKRYFAEQARKIADRYSLTQKKSAQVSWAKILYYAERDMVGFGAIDPLMRDPNIEDISVDGSKRPVFVYHRRYESLESNLFFSEEQKLDDMIVRLVHMSGRHVSTAFPIVDATMPGRHRLAATFRKEVSPQGSTMTIRKFRADPITVIDLINFGVLDYAMAAYSWLLIESRLTAVVVGATASGKTTFLNALLSMINPTSKIVTIEEVQEINIHHINWAPLVSRLSYGLTEEAIGEVSLFHLVKAAMRMRPDILVVGEVRGEEAYALFQAISTGHGGLATLHAEDAGSAIQRLTSKPMDVAPSYLNFLDLLYSVRRVAIPNPGNLGRPKIVRRVIALSEIIDSTKWVDTFVWDPTKDKFVESLEKSVKLRKLAKDQGKTLKDMVQEIQNRVIVLQWLRSKNIRNFVEISTIFSQYHANPEALLTRIKIENMDLLGKRAATQQQQQVAQPVQVQSTPNQTE
ncbi:MAG TPA: type II/IV secretion system ATPase subunit [Nitrososphaerales archaeon]|nr:type II/IV secretion system ATPase subunit [Nitrososphaerales archaeon]